MEAKLKVTGTLRARVIRAAGPGMGWKLRNMLRWGYVWGWITTLLARAFTKLTAVPTIVCRLEARLIRADGTVINFGVLSRRAVTDAGVAFVVDDWDTSATDVTTFNNHASGTGTTAENANQTALVAEATTVTDRAAGTKTQPQANQIQSVATQTFTGSAAITEHGIFSSATEGSGTMWDRSVFAALNVATGDSIQFTHITTFNSGG